MSLPVIFSPEARAEFLDAANWYEAERHGTGLRFMARVDDVIERIEGWPQLHPIVHRDLRRALVRGFPYAVIHRVEPGRRDRGRHRYAA
jgi:hypothetical protein